MVLMLKSNIADYRQEITLMDGRKMALRPICSEDKKACLALHSRLSEGTRFLRFQYYKGDLTESDLKNFCEVDYNNTLALVAEAEFGGRKEIVGVGRYYRLPDNKSAEVSFVVQDSEQRKGIGTQLLKHLAILARQRDIHYFVAEVLKVNGRMISIFRKSDPGIKQVSEDGSSCIITLSVSEVIRTYTDIKPRAQNSDS